MASKTGNPFGDGSALVKSALADLGVNFMVYHLFPTSGDGNMARRVQAIDESMRECGLKYMLNNEIPNFVKSAEIAPGVNEFTHPDGTHRWDLRMSWLDPILPPQKAGQAALLGVTYDECEHMQLTGNMFVHTDDKQRFDAPFLVDTKGKDLITSYNLLVEKCKQLKRIHYKDRLTLSTEDVWPDMFHIFARAGWTITPKILKENLSSVVMSISLGAALEYKNSDADWWVSPDLWCKSCYPGHSPQALKSALMMGYWLGAEALYVENLDYPGRPGKRHPLASPTGSLISWEDDGSYKLTNHGKVVQDFYKRYVPEHPRSYSWRDYRPRVAIIRLPDGAWGQRGTMYRDRLLGNPDHPMDDVSAEWLQVWPILTHGVARPGAISINNHNVYPEYPWPFFVPIDSVAVFDHLVTGPVLDSVECFIVCGHALSDQTFNDIAVRVKNGATCIISRSLYNAHTSGSLQGKWVIVDSFTDPVVSTSLKPYLGPHNVARFRFKGFTVEFRAEDNKDVVEPKIIPVNHE
ncbi:MAG: hypothetical protein ABFD83_04330 [Armatimonadota bacterium]